MMNYGSPRLSRRLRRSLLLSAFVGSSFLAILGMKAEEPVRVASKLSTSGYEKLQAFARGKSTPWELLGQQAGYFEMHVSDLMRKPKLKEFLEDELKKYELTQENIGVSLTEAADCLTGNLEVSFSKSEKEEDEHKHNLMVTSTSFEMTFQREIDWAPLVRETIAMTQLLPNEMGTTLRDWMKGLTQSNKLTLISKQQAEGVNEVGQKALWQSIAGGYASFVFVPKGMDQLDVTKSNAQLEELEAAWLKVFHQVQCVGVGIDFGGEPSSNLFRVALVPNKQTKADEFESNIRAAHEKSRQYMTTHSGESSADVDADVQAWIQVMCHCQISTRKDEGASPCVILAGECSDRLLFSMP